MHSTGPQLAGKRKGRNWGCLAWRRDSDSWDPSIQTFEEQFYRKGNRCVCLVGVGARGQNRTHGRKRHVGMSQTNSRGGATWRNKLPPAADTRLDPARAPPEACLGSRGESRGWGLVPQLSPHSTCTPPVMGLWSSKLCVFPSTLHCVSSYFCIQRLTKEGWEVVKGSGMY